MRPLWLDLILYLIGFAYFVSFLNDLFRGRS